MGVSRVMGFTWLGLMLGCGQPDSVTSPASVSRDSGSEETVIEDYGAGVTGLTARIDETFGSLVHVSWTQNGPAQVSVAYRVDSDEWLQTPVVETTGGPVEQLLLGVPYDTEVTLSIVVASEEANEASSSIQITTDIVPVRAPVPEMLVGDETLWESTGRYLLASLADWTGGEMAWVVLIDRQGRLVWARPSPSFRVTMFAQPGVNHDSLLIDHNSFWGELDGGASSEVVRLKLDGTVVETVPTPGLHHPFTELPDGSLVWGAGGEDFLDETLQKRHPDGTVETVWSCAEFLREVGREKGNYCGSNNIFYHESTDSFLYSFYSLDTVVEIDHLSGETARYFGHVADGSWVFSPEDSAFWWQHGAHYTTEGTMLVSTRSAQDGSETMVREYTLDEAGQALVEVWRFGGGEGLYGETGGEAHRLPGGNTLHNYGDMPRVREVTPDGAVVWDVKWAEGFWLGKSVFVEDLYAFID